MRIARFPLGRIVATPGALEALEDAGDSPAAFLKRQARSAPISSAESTDVLPFLTLCRGPRTECAGLMGTT